MKSSKLIMLSLSAMGILSFQGCSNITGNAVLAVTKTVVGVDISQNEVTKTPDVTLAYKRQEFAYVPTNRFDNNISKNGASDSANVLMELKYAGVNSNGIYQRLAIGSEAVKAPIATLMFLRNESGNIDENVAKYYVDKVKVDEEIKEDRKKIDTLISDLFDGGKDLNQTKLSNSIKCIKENGKDISPKTEKQLDTNVSNFRNLLSTKYNYLLDSFTKCIKK